MTIREKVVQDVEKLGDFELRQLAEYLAFLQYRMQMRSMAPVSEMEVASLYAEFADEDRQMAEEGMAEFAKHLAGEDSL